MSVQMAHRTGVPENARLRARFKYHVDGQHKVPMGGATETHLYACEWCEPRPVLHDDDREFELILVPAWMGENGGNMEAIHATMLATMDRR